MGILRNYGVQELAPQYLAAAGTVEPRGELANQYGPLSGAAQLAAARKVLQGRGYDSYDGQFWNSEDQLNALVGVLHESADGKYQHLFFFVNGRYIGVDATAASGSVRIVGASNNVVTVSYGIYQPTDALAMPSTRQQVRFEWTGSTLVPLDPIPPSATNAVAGR